MSHNLIVISHPSVFTYNNKKICKIVFDMSNTQDVEIKYSGCHPIPFEYKCFTFSDNNIEKFKSDIEKYKIEENNTDFYYGEIYNVISEYLLRDDMKFN